MSNDSFGDDNDPTRDDRSYVTDDMLAALNTERSVHPEESEEELSRRLMRENLPAVTMGMVHTALHSTNERVRLDASKYITERVLGKVGEDAFAGTAPVEDLISEVTEYVKEQASS